MNPPRLRAGLVQLCVSDDPERNLPETRALVREAAETGAQWVLTPEATNILNADRATQDRVLRTEDADPTLAALRGDARALGIWLLIGSLSLKTGEAGDDRFANRSFLIAPDGGIRARYDKLHMFDVRVSDRESYRESAAFRPGDRAVVGMGPWPIGMTVCYDLRFPHLYRDLAQAGAQVLIGGQRTLEETGGLYVEPTIFDGVDNAMKIAQEEIFGPALSVISFDSAEEAVAIANDTPYGLAAAVWTADLSKAHRTARALRAGSVWVNQYDGGDMTAPFGGYKQSGNGRDKSLHAFEKYTEVKATWINLAT